MADVELHGRRDLLEHLADLTTPVTVLVGDSGTGKTAALEESQAASAAVAPDPVQVGRAPGSLQLALLESLASAVALMAQDATATQRIGQILADAASRVTEVRLKDLRAAVGKHLLSMVRARVGDEMADLLEDFGSALTVSAEESLGSRITAASDGDVVDQIVSFAAEVKAMAGEREVHVALDDLDRLDDGDLRRLADLPGRLPFGFCIRGSFTTWHSTSRQRFEMLQMGGITGVPIGGLGESDIEAWLDADGLDVGLADTVMAATNGYPVHVADALELLHRQPSTATLSSLTPDQVIQVRTRQAWRELDIASQIVAAKLCFYRDPLATPRVCSLLGLDEMAWGTFAMRLTDAGLLLEDQRRWFHELRRRVIWRDLLTEEMRRTAIEAATDELRGQLALPGARPTDFVDFARAAAQNEELQQVETGVAEAVKATREEVAIAAAALELIEYSHGEEAIDAEVLLAHARDTYTLVDGALSALDRLVGRGLMHVASNDRAAVAVPMWGSQATVQAIIGRAADELGRIPIVQLATAAFEVAIRPRLGPFVAAMYGVGAPSMAEASEAIASQHRQPRDGVVHLGGREPGIAIRGSHGTVPLSAMVSCRDEVERDAAVARLDQVSGELWGENVTLDDVLRLPTQVVPSLRFARALKWLKGRRDFSLHMQLPIDAPQRYSVAERVAASQRLRAVVRERSSAIERFAYELEDPTGYAYAHSGDGELVVELGNSTRVVEISTAWMRDLHAPFGRLRLAEDLGLEPGQFVRRITWHTGGAAKDPITETIVDLSKAATRFNKNQLPTVVEFEETQLRALLQGAFDRCESDAKALLEALPGMGLSLPTPTTLFAVLELDEPSADWVPGANALLSTALVPMQGDERVMFQLIRGAGSATSGRFTRGEALQAAFDIDPTTALSSSTGEAIGGLSKLLGFGRGEVRFRYVDP